MMVAVILAGGGGTRLWPLARTRSPKPFVPLDDGVTLFRRTYDRIVPMVGPSRIVVVTSAADVARVREQAPRIPASHILSEEVGRDTAASVGLAAHWLRARWGDPVMVVLPADHRIRPASAFRAAVRRAARAAERPGALVTIGVRPRGPDTGLGYIRPRSGSGKGDALPVSAFVEKPGRRRATSMVRSGRYLWNTGIFSWRASAVLAGLALHRPDVARPLQLWSGRGRGGTGRVPATVMRRIPSVSIDRAVLERSRNVSVVRGAFQWSDVGNWDAIAALMSSGRRRNVGLGRVLTFGARGCLGANPDGLTVFVGVNDVVAVRSEQIVLVCHRDEAQEMRSVVRQLKGPLARYR